MFKIKSSDLLKNKGANSRAQLELSISDDILEQAETHRELFEAFAERIFTLYFLCFSQAETVVDRLNAIDSLAKSMLQETLETHDINTEDTNHTIH